MACSVLAIIGWIVHFSRWSLVKNWQFGQGIWCMVCPCLMALFPALRMVQSRARRKPQAKTKQRGVKTGCRSQKREFRKVNKTKPGIDCCFWLITFSEKYQFFILSQTIPGSDSMTVRSHCDFFPELRELFLVKNALEQGCSSVGFSRN